MKDKKRVSIQEKEIAKLLFSALMAFFCFLSYLVEIRPIIASSLGIYYTGLLDGAVIVLAVLSIGFYLFSKLS